MPECNICNKEIEETFLKKIRGTYIKVNKKSKTVCSVCQKKFPGDKLKEQLK